MISDSAVILISGVKGDAGRPLLLEPVLFAPVLRWVYEGLRQNGTARFFLSVPGEWLEAAAECVPGAVAVPAESETLEEELKAFAAEAEGAVVTVTAPVWLSLYGSALLNHSEQLPWGGKPSGVNRVEGKILAQRGISALGSGEFLPVGGELPCVLPLYSRKDLDDIRYTARCEKLAALEDSGVTFLDRDSVYIDPQVSVGAGTLILPNVILRGDTIIGEDCELGPNTMLRDCVIGSRTTVNASQANGARVGEDVRIGPWANLRPGTVLGNEVHVGNFVETKNSVVGEKTWISHLTYVGDADVGEDCNFGCGCVTANFDGEHKYRTEIGNRVFLGCNTTMVAPVTLEDGAYTAAGTIVTERVPKESLAIGRSRQEIKPGWAEGRELIK